MQDSLALGRHLKGRLVAFKVLWHLVMEKESLFEAPRVLECKILWRAWSAWSVCEYKIPWHLMLVK